MLSRLMMLFSLFPVLMAQVAWAEMETEQSSPHQTIPNIPRLNQFDQPATTVDEWVTQLTQFSNTQVRNVFLTPTVGGVNVILESGQPLPTPLTSVVGNAFIAEFANTELHLAEGEFQAANPTKGIALVSVTSLPNNRVRVAITGVDTPPTVNLSLESQGLVLAITPKTEIVTTDEDAIEIL